MDAKFYIRKTTANRKWGHWSTINFAADVWNSLDITLRKAPTLLAFKRSLFARASI
jgi:hypothetical protein